MILQLVVKPMKRLSVGLLVSFAVASLASDVSARDTEDRDALIARYLEWRGGEAYTTAKSIIREGRLETSGLAGPIKVVQMRDGRQYVNADLEVIEVTEVLLPEGSWLVNPSGQVEDMGSVPEANARRGHAFDFAKPLLERDSGLLLIGDEERGGATWRVLRLSYDDGDYHDLFIDPDSGAMEWVRARQDTEIFWLRFDDWRFVDGVRLPGVRQELHEAQTRNATYTWTDDQINSAIPDGLFERPVAARRATILESAPSTGWLPFEFFRRQRIILPAVVNGFETYAILDSGAEMTALDTEVARAAGLTGTGSVTAEGTGGTAEVQFASDVAILVGDLELRDVTVAILDLGELGRRLLGRPIPVILGKEIFNETVVDIDYPNSRIAFHDPALWSYEGGGTTVALPELADSRVVEISVEGGEPILASFDIGQGSALALFEAYVKGSGLLEGRRSSTRRGGGVGGEVISPITTLRTLNFGGVQFQNVPVTLSLGAEGSFDTEREQGNLGTDIYSRFRMIVSYGSDELYLEPDADRVHTEFDHDRAGVQLQVGDGVGEVIHVMAGSPAVALGLAVGDKVRVINGQPVGNDYWTSDQWRWPFGAAGTEVELNLSDGRTIKLTLADFY